MNIDLTNAVIERCNKLTEETIQQESSEFLNTPIHYFKKHFKEFLYIESPVFDDIKVDALSIELDDVFRTYMALFGLKVKKKYAETIKNYLEEHLHTDSVKNYSILFSADEGLWEINLPMDYIQGFQEEMSIGQAIGLTYDFIRNLVYLISANE